MTSLDPYADEELAELYDLDHASYTDDLAMYEQFARRAGTPSLELGAGTGRVARHLAEQGLGVAALDASPHMLARFASSVDAEAAGRVRLVEADMRAFQLNERFDLVYCALNTFEHLLTAGEQRSMLRCAAGHLTRGGIFVFELRPLTAVDWTQTRTPLELDWVRTEPRTGDVVTKMSSRALSPAQQLTTDTLIFDRVAADGSARRRLLEVTLRLTGRFELEMLVASAGLRLSALYGDSDLSPFDDGSDTMIAVAELEGA